MKSPRDLARDSIERKVKMKMIHLIDPLDLGSRMDVIQVRLVMR
jgi:hypothetical protein